MVGTIIIIAVPSIFALLLLNKLEIILTVVCLKKQYHGCLWKSYDEWHLNTYFANTKSMMFYLLYAVYGDFRVLFCALTIQFIEDSEFVLSIQITTAQSFLPINNIEPALFSIHLWKFSRPSYLEKNILRTNNSVKCWCNEFLYPSFHCLGMYCDVLRRF